MLVRELEAEVMDDSAESAAYDAMDHGAVNRLFVDDLLAEGPLARDILDLGTGTARIPIELCLLNADCRVMASDAAVSMLEIARYNLAVSGVEDRIQLHHGDSKRLDLDDEMFDVVISNSLIHHLPDPAQALREMHRVVKPGGRVFVRDLCRPGSMQEVDRLVASYTQGESELARQLFRQSLLAALTVGEMQQLIRRLDFERASVAMSSDRHWTWSAIR